jgi:DNA-binding transcriptional LysR family regulator
MLRLGTNLPPLKVLPVNLPIPPWPVGLLSLKDRTVAPVVQLFVDCVRDAVRTLRKARYE